MPITEKQRHRRGHPFYPTAADQLPPLYATDKVCAPEKLIRVHYFVGACDWWLAEYDPHEQRAFGFCCLGDAQNAEWGYVDLEELEWLLVGGIWVVERDLYWRPTVFREVPHVSCVPQRRETQAYLRGDV